MNDNVNTSLTEVNWGVLGCGHIANTFMSSLRNVTKTKAIACAARDISRAKSFAEQYGLTQFFDNYQTMLRQREIHAVYIATTHNFHFEHIMMCLQHGKHVLCEKPLTLNANQARKAFALAKQNNLLLIEAVWTRFLPAILALQSTLAQGVIGNVQCVQANFSLNRELADEHRLNNKQLAGGALLDLGIYPITIADIVFGEVPLNISTSAIKTHTDVDKNSFYTLEYESGAVAQLSAGFRMSGPTYATIMGDKGVIHVPFFLGAKSFTVTLEGEEPVTHEYPFGDQDNFKFEIAHFTQVLLETNHEQQIQSDLMPASTSMRVLSIMDTIRQQWGLVYDNEN